jgi:O-antigen/teichoic acid export membrane protein
MATNVKKFAKTSLLLMLGQGSGQALSLLRNAIIGHLLSPRDFGIASTFAITVSIIEMASDMGSDKLLVQAKDGNDTLLQNTAQFFAIIRGFISGFFLFLVAPYVAALFKISEAEWAFSLLAFVPIIRGFMHFDVKRFHREMNFFPNLFAELTPQVITFLLTFPIVMIRTDYSAVINLILLQSLLLVLMTHFLAKRRYKITFDQLAIKRLVEFGWPLMINGFLMFFIFQGDKFVIGIYYDMEKLGVYSAAFMITMTPALLIIKVLTSLILPFFSRKQDDIALLNVNYLLSTEITVLIVSAYIAFFTLYGDIFLTLVFGKHYQGYGDLMISLGILWSLRMLRVPATLLAMSKGDTKVGLIANIFRSLALFGVFYFAMKQYPIETIAYVGCVGELLAVFITLKQIKHKFDEQYISFLHKIALFLFSMLVSMLYVFYGEVNLTNTLILSIAFLLLFLLIVRSLYHKLSTHEKNFSKAGG